MFNLQYYNLAFSSSMYFDEDGDLAHEFYEEVKINDSETTAMRRKLANLRPQASRVILSH